MPQTPNVAVATPAAPPSPITALDYVSSIVGKKGNYSGEDHKRAGLPVLGDCELCQATIASYNAHPSRSGYLRCSDCIGDSGFPTVQAFAVWLCAR